MLHGNGYTNIRDVNSFCVKKKGKKKHIIGNFLLTLTGPKVRIGIC